MTAALRVLVVDDEPVALQRLRRLLSDIDGVEVVSECRNGREALAAIANLHPDVVLLDIQMPVLDGLGVARALPADAAPMVIFVTASGAHATTAFDVRAIDYVVKPVEPARLAAALTRARHLRELENVAERHARLLAFVNHEFGDEAQAAPIGASGNANRVERFLVRDGERRIFIETAAIVWIESEGNYVRLHLTSGRSHLVRSTMAQVEASLDHEQFVRIHRSSIVNLSRVREIQPWLSGDSVVVLDTGEKLRLGRGYRRHFEARGKP